MRAIIVSEPVYGTKMVLVCDCRLLQFRDYVVRRAPAAVDEFSSEADDDDSRDALSYFDGMRTFIWLEEAAGLRPLTINTLSHEVTHAVLRVMRELGFEVVEANDETAAYLVGYYLENFYRKLQKKA